MHDFDYDAMQKKRIANNARRMKNGSKSKRCSLPSDYMTQAEWKRRNGPVSTYKLDSPMSWAEFSRMPDDLKVRYINNLRELYGATDRMFAEMFGIHFTHFSRIRAGLGVTSRMPRTRDDEIKLRAKAWNAFRNGVANDESPVEEPVSEETVAEEHVSEEAEFSPEECAEEVVVPSFVLKEEVIKPLSLDELTAVFTGVFDPTAFLQWLAQLPIPEDSVRIKVEVTRK